MAADCREAVAHEGRRRVVRRLAERSTTAPDLERPLGARRSAVSQDVARLRAMGLVTRRREGKAMRCCLSDPGAQRTIRLRKARFRPEPSPPRPAG